MKLCIFRYGEEGLLFALNHWGALYNLGLDHGWEPHGTYITGLYAQTYEEGPFDANDPRFRKPYPDRKDGYFTGGGNEITESDSKALAGALRKALMAATIDPPTCLLYQPMSSPEGTFFAGSSAVAMAAEFFDLPDPKYIM